MLGSAGGLIGNPEFIILEILCTYIDIHYRIKSVVVECPLRVWEVLGSNLPGAESHQRHQR